MTLSWADLENVSFTPWRLWESVPLIVAYIEYYDLFQGQGATNWLPTEHSLIQLISILFPTLDIICSHHFIPVFSHLL